MLMSVISRLGACGGRRERERDRDRKEKWGGREKEEKKREDKTNQQTKDLDWMKASEEGEKGERNVERKGGVRGGLTWLGLS